MASGDPKFYCQPDENDSEEIKLLKEWLKWQLENNAIAKTNVFNKTLVFLIERHYESMNNLSTADLEN